MSSPKDTSSISSGPTCVTSLNLNGLLKGPVSTESHTREGVHKSAPAAQRVLLLYLLSPIQLKCHLLATMPP